MIKIKTFYITYMHSIINYMSIIIRLAVNKLTTFKLYDTSLACVCVNLIKLYLF